MSPESRAGVVSQQLPRELAAELLALARAHGADFAEVYGEHTTLTTFVFEESRLKSSELRVVQGLGVRAIRGSETGYAYADGFDPDDLREAARVASRIARDGAAGSRPVAFHAVDAAPPFTLREPAASALDEDEVEQLIG